MNRLSKLNSSDRLFVYASLLCLFLTTFPLAQGWISRGDFIIRIAFIAFALVVQPKAFMSKDLLFLAFYFFYVFITDVSDAGVGLIAKIMEFLLPAILANFYLDSGKNDSRVEIIARFAIASTIIIMINTIIIDHSYSGIVRAMVMFSAQGDTEQGVYYTRLGVCGYAFAMISMCLAPVFIYMSRGAKKKLFYLGCTALVLYFVYITGITTCLLILVIMLVLYYSSRNIKKAGSLFPIAIVSFLVVYIAGFAIVELVLPFFEGTIFYGHLGGLMEFYGKSTAVTDTYDVEGRVDLYRDSMDTFFSHFLFGSASGKIGGHNFFLDHLARNGIIGMMPFYIFLFMRLKKASRFLSEKSRVIYTICIIGLLFLGFLKGMNGIDYWTYMFVYIPCLLNYSDNYVAH